MGLFSGLLSGCNDNSSERSEAVAAATSAVPDTPELRAAARAEIEAFLAELEPIDPTWTSDRQTRVQRETRLGVLELASRDPSVGRAAREAFDEQRLDALLARKALIEIAAKADPVGSRDRLVALVREYVPGQDLVRTEGARFLAETSPEVAAELFEELLTESQNVTLPPAELLLRYWTLAARDVAEQRGVDLDPTFLADIATDLTRPAELRYVAIAELGRTPGNLSKAALRRLLVESGPDGLLRRKAAQALLELLPPDEACAIFIEVADKETQGMFLPFLLDLLEQNCP